MKIKLTALSTMSSLISCDPVSCRKICNGVVYVKWSQGYSCFPLILQKGKTYKKRVEELNYK